MTEFNQEYTPVELAVLEGQWKYILLGTYDAAKYKITDCFSVYKSDSDSYFYHVTVTSLTDKSKYSRYIIQEGFENSNKRFIVD